MTPWQWLLLVVLAGPALAQQAPRGEPRELIYGAELMTAQEREEYRRSVSGAQGDEARARVRARHRERLRERARQKGVMLREPHGVRQPAAK